MELFNSKIKKFLIFSQNKAFLIIPEIEPCTFQSKLEKIKKNSLREIFLYFRKRKPRRNSKRKPRENSLFQETEFSYISGKVYSES